MLEFGYCSSVLDAGKMKFGNQRVLILPLCFMFLIANSLAYPSDNSQNKPNWFHISANIFRIKYVLPINASANTNITMDVAVPENNIFQKLITVSSEPDSNMTFTDGKGLTRMRYELTTTAPQLLNITIYYTVMILFSSLTIDSADVVDQRNVSTEIHEQYTKPEPYIESDDPNIIGNATMIAGNDTTIDAKTTKLFDFVSNSSLFRYDETIQNMTRDSYSHTRGALWALQNRKGVCFDFAHLFVALLRSLGICSRVSEGVILDGRSGFILHNWAEVYSNEIGWIPYDPTWDKTKCNIHMKILNPSYDKYTRWNYSINSGILYKFPENSSYAINDDVYIQNITYPNVTDLFTLDGNSHFRLTRTLKLNNETTSSSIDILQGKQIVDNFYGGLVINLFENILGIESIDYSPYFSWHLPKSMQIQIVAPWSLIFLNSTFPTLSNVSYNYTFGSVHFGLIGPLLWIGMLLIILVVVFALIIYFKKVRKNRMSYEKILAQNSHTEAERGQRLSVRRLR